MELEIKLDDFSDTGKIVESYNSKVANLFEMALTEDFEWRYNCDGDDRIMSNRKSYSKVGAMLIRLHEDHDGKTQMFLSVNALFVAQIIATGEAYIVEVNND
jgi:hypothetical protein